jgi:hypothetical protein
MSIEKIKNDAIKIINEKGRTIRDNRLQRNVRTLNCHMITHAVELSEQKSYPLEEKYKKDWERMYSSYVAACNEFINDPNTRRACILNTSNYYEHFPCFLTMEVLSSWGDNYDLIVFQRSADMQKFEADMNFFQYVLGKIKKRTGKNINRIIVFYASIHYEAKS